MADRGVAVKLDLEVAQFLAGAQKADRSLEKVGRTTEQTAAHVERMTRHVNELGASLRALPNDTRVKVDVSIDRAAIRREMLALQSEGLKVRAGLDTSRWQADAQAAARKIKVEANARLEVRVDGRLSERDLQRQLDRMRLRVRVRPDAGGGGIDIPVGGGGSGGGRGSGGSILGTRLSGLGSTVGGIGVLTAFLPQAVAGANALTAALTASAGTLGSITGLAGALPALFTAGAGAAATIGLSLFGVFDAVTQMENVQEQAGTAALAAGMAAKQSAAAQRAAAQQVTAARRGLVSATEGVTLAERGVARAQQTAARAQDDLNDAIREEQDRRRDLQNQLKRGALDEERALLNIRQAEADLREARRTGQGIADADLSLREQQQALVELRQERAADAEAAADAARTGVRGSDLVVAAQDRVRDSAEGVQDAQRGLRDAQQGVVLAQEAMAEAGRASVEASVAGVAAQSAAVTNLQNALADLSPEQRRFAEFIYGLKDEFGGLRAAAARGLLPGLEQDITRSLVLLPTFERALERTGRTLTNLDDGKRRFTNADGISRINTVLRSADGLTGSLGRSGILLGDAFLHVGVAAAPMVRQIGLAAERSSELVLAYAKSKQESGEMADSFGRIYDRADLLASILGNVRGALAGTFGAGMDSGDSMLAGLDRLTQRWEAWVDSIEGQAALREWFDEGRRGMTELGGLIGDVREEFDGFTDNASFADFVAQIRELVPYAADLLKTFTGSGDTGRRLAGALVEIMQALDEINAGGALRVFVETLAGLVTIVAQLVQTIPGGAEAIGALVAAFAAYKAISLFAGALAAVRTGAMGLRGAFNPAIAAVAAFALVWGGVQRGQKEAGRDFAAGVTENLGLMRDGSLAQQAAAQRAYDQAIAQQTDFVNRQAGKSRIGQILDFGDSAQAKKAKELLGTVGEAEEQLAAKIKTTNAEVARYADQQGLFAEERAAANSAYTAAVIAGEDGIATLQRDNLRITEQQMALAEKAGVVVGDSYGTIKSKIDAYLYSQTAAGRAAAEAAADYDTLRDATAGAAEQADALRRSFERLHGGTLDAREAALAHRDAIAATERALRENGRGLDINTEAGRANQSVLIDARRALDEKVAAAKRAGASDAVLRAIIQEGSEELRRRVTKLAETDEAAAAMNTTLKLTPRDIAIAIKMAGVSEAQEALKAIQTRVTGIMELMGVSKEEAQRIVQSDDRRDKAASGQQGIRRAAGGPVWGAGTATSDSIPALLSNGEYVIRASAAAHYGPELLDAINAGRYANGGPVGRYAEGGRVGMTMPVTIDQRIVQNAMGDLVEAFKARVGAGAGLGLGLGAGALSGFQQQMLALRAAFPGLALISGLRPGAITATGNPSYHGKGRAVDIPPRLDVNRWIAQNYGSRTKELILTKPGAINLRNGRPHSYREPTRSMHRDHIHWAMNRGGQVGQPLRRAAGGPVNPLGTKTLSQAAAGLRTVDEVNRLVAAYDRYLEQIERAAEKEALILAVVVARRDVAAATTKEARAAAQLREQDARGALLAHDTETRARAERDAVEALTDALERQADAQQVLIDQREEARQAAQESLAQLNELLDQEADLRARGVALQGQYEQTVQDIAARREANEASHYARLADLAADYQRKQQDLIDGRREQLLGFARIDEQLAMSWGSSVRWLTSNTTAQAKQLADWMGALQAARDRGVSESVITALGLDEGPQAIGQLRQFAKATDAEIAALNAALAARTAAGNQQVITERQRGYGQLGQALTQAAAQYATALEDLQAQFVESQAELDDALEQAQAELLVQQAELALELAALGGEQGRSYGEAIAAAMRSQIPAVLAAAADLRAAMEGLNQNSAPAPTSSADPRFPTPPPALASLGATAPPGTTFIYGPGGSWQASGPLSLAVYLGNEQLDGHVEARVNGVLQQNVLASQIAGGR